MNENGLMHPGRSVDFLSRLHDGELTQSERVRFEAHRTHCAECRRAAIEFEDAISLFRSTRSTPPRSDLAARILRKVQSTNRPRTPFPQRFRVDLGWAALLLTALFAILITTPLVVRRTEVAPPPAPRTQDTAARAAPQVVPESLRRPPAASPARETRPLEKSSIRPQGASDRAPSVAGEAVPPAKEAETASRNRVAAVEARRDEPRATLAAPGPASAGGEGDVALRPAPAAAPLRLSISEIDGFGAPPALLSEVRIDLPASERGHEYVLRVDSQGTVREVSRADLQDSNRPAGARKQIAKAEPAAPPPLSRLRFEPGNRPRRLLVRID
jgi:hypothetical protein